jgi:hypothetical protein
MCDVNSSIERACTLVRQVVMRTPGIARQDLVQEITAAMNCHPSTVTRAISDSTELGHIKKTTIGRTVTYVWDDYPAAIDTAPRIVTVLPAAEAPRLNIPAFSDPITWGFHHCLRGYA